MPSSMNIPVPPTALTLSFGGVDFRLDPDGLIASDDTQVSFQGKDGDIVVNLTSFTGTLRVSMSSLMTEESSNKPSRVSLEPMTRSEKHTSTTTSAKVVEEAASPADGGSKNKTTAKARAAKISPRQQQLNFGKNKPASKARTSSSSKKSNASNSNKSTEEVTTETPAAAASSTAVLPDKPQKERVPLKRTLVEIQTNPVPSPTVKKSRAEESSSSDDLMHNTSQMSQPSLTQLSQQSNANSNNDNQMEFTQGDTVNGDEDQGPDDFFIASQKSKEEESGNVDLSAKSISSEPSHSDHENTDMDVASLNDDALPLDDVTMQQQSERSGKPPPSARWGHSMTKLEGDRILVYGGQGFDAESGKLQILSDIHVYDMKKHSWYRPVNCEGVPRQWHTATYLPERQLLISFGGETKHPKTGRITTTDQVMVLDTEIMLWYPPTVSGTVPSGRSGHSATMLPDTNELVVFGGVKGSKWQNSVAVLDVSRWKWSSPRILGDAPRPRSYHSATAITTDDGVSRLVIFGGNDAVSSFNTVHILETDGKRWSWINPTVKGTIPSARTGHCATLLGDNKTILIYGGWDPNADDEDVSDDEIIFSDSYLLNTEKWEWRLGPKPRFAGDGESIENSLAENGGDRRVGHRSVLIDSTEAMVFGGRIPGDKFACDFQTLALE